MKRYSFEVDNHYCFIYDRQQGMKIGNAYGIDYAQKMVDALNASVVTEVPITLNQMRKRHGYPRLPGWERGEKVE